MRFTLLATALLALLTTGAATAQAPADDWIDFHRGVIGDREVTLASSLEQQPTPPPGQTSTASEIAVQMARDWMISNGFLHDNQILNQNPVVTIGADGITISWNGPGVHITVVLSNGPFVPVPTYPDLRFVSGIISQIYNGF